jgi:hypothetical protein
MKKGLKILIAVSEGTPDHNNDDEKGRDLGYFYEDKTIASLTREEFDKEVDRLRDMMWMYVEYQKNI